MQLRVFVLQDLLVLVPCRLVSTDAIFRYSKQEQSPPQNLTYKGIDYLLQTFLATLLDKRQRLALSLAFFASAVVKDK